MPGWQASDTNMSALTLHDVGTGVMEDAYMRSPEECLRHLQCDATTGLSDEEALSRQLKFGRNEMPPDEGVPFWKLVLKQFDDLLVKILIASAVISFLLAVFDGESGAAFVEPLVIVLILVANATVAPARSQVPLSTSSCDALAACTPCGLRKAPSYSSETPARLTRASAADNREKNFRNLRLLPRARRRVFKVTSARLTKLSSGPGSGAPA